MEVAIKDVGPIKTLKIVAPPGSVTVLRGPNGSGKTTALTALSKVSGSKKTAGLSKRDGALKGSIEGAGVTMKVTASGAGKASGELEFSPIDEDLTIADIVNPGVKDPVAADRKRIEATCSILGLVPKLSQFSEAFEGCSLTIDEVATLKAREADSVVVMARQLKADCDASARSVEADITELQDGVAAKVAQVEGIDFDAESDADVLDAAVEAAARTYGSMQNAATIATKSRESLAGAGDYVEPATLGKQIVELIDLFDKLDKEVDQLQLSLEAKIKDRDDCSANLKELRSQMDSAKLRSQLEQQVKDGPTDEALEQARTAVDQAKLARDNGVLIRRGLEAMADVEKAHAEVERLTSVGLAIREAGKKALGALAGMLAGTGMAVDESGRLVVEHRLRGETYYSELSDGERWELAIQIAVESFARRKMTNGLLVIPQEAWEGLDETGRRVIVDAVHGTTLRIVTAEAAGQRGVTQVHSETLV